MKDALNGRVFDLFNNERKQVYNIMIENTKISQYNVAYKVINDYSHLISYASVSLAGGVTFGIPGIVVGLGVSIFDDFLTYNNYINKKSLTQGFVGLMLGYNIYPSWSSGLIGTCGSIVISQEIFKNYHNEIANLFISTILGARVGGASGAFVGGALSITDQVLLYNNITNKYYFSHGALGGISFSLVFDKSIPFNIAGIMLGIVFVKHTNNTATSIKPIDISQDLYKVYLKILPQGQLDDYIKEYSIVLLSLQILANQLRMILVKHQQNSMYQFEHMDEPNEHAISKLTLVTIKFGLFLLPYVITEFVSNIINSFYSTRLYIQLDDMLRKTLFSNETTLKISLNKNNTVLIDNLRSDSKVISRDSSKLIVDAITKSINGLYGIGVLMINVPEILLYSMLYNKCTEYISTILAEIQNKYEILIKDQESIISSLFKHDMKNIKIITETAGIMYSYNQLQLEHDKLRENELIKDQILYLMSAWRSFESIANFILTYYLIGYKVGIGAIDFDNRINMHSSCLQVSSLLAWNGEKSQEIKTLYQSMERLSKFLDETIFDTYCNIKDVDNIKRGQCADDKKLIISNLNIIVANKQLIHVDYLELEFGNRYVIIGPPGSGKSSFITKIIGITQNNVGGDGNVCYPKDVKISLISQQNYFPLNKNMQEIIFYPREVNQDKVLLVQQLLTRVGLIQYKIDQVEDWYSVLSGGQKQEVKIISAIMQEPNILILDEVFNGLDKKSIELMQQIIIEQLPDILVISIDHHSSENNSTGFYTNYLKIIEGNLAGDYNNPRDHDKLVECELFEAFIINDQKCYDYEY